MVSVDVKHHDYLLSKSHANATSLLKRIALKAVNNGHNIHVKSVFFGVFFKPTRKYNNSTQVEKQSICFIKTFTAV